MKKLFILGNGFDLAHGLLTHYSDFRKFLNEECGGKISYYPETHMDKDGDIIADRESTIGLLIDLIDNTAGEEDWKDVEKVMAEFDYLSYFEDLDEDAAIKSDNDNEMFWTAYAREDRASDLSCCVKEIKNLFGEWIDTIEVDATPQKRFIDLFDEDSCFLTFNYTDTLEQIYKIAPTKICHIHGEQGEEIIVGHGSDNNPYDVESWETFAIEWTLKSLFDELKKNVHHCFIQHKRFFEKIATSGIVDIYSFGLGFSEPDCYYIKQLCKLIDTTNISWHLSAYDTLKERNKQKKAIIDSGFKGNFGTLIPE